MKTDLWNYLKTTKKPIVLYGMGNGAEKIINMLNIYGISISGIFASDEFVRNKEFFGHKIEKYSDVKNRLVDMIVLVCFGSNRQEVIDNIIKISNEQELYVPDVPVYGDGLFNWKYYQDNMEEIKRLYNLLADETSKNTLSNIINYKLTGKINFLFNCEVNYNEPYKNFLHLDNNESYLDLGAYNGDTVTEFCKIVNNKYSSIYAVEPDDKSFKKLTKNTLDIKNINLFNCCISDKKGIMDFEMRGGRNSSISSNGKRTACETVDSLMLNKNVTFIKADVEGEESGMILGAKNTIATQRPKMQIACYHRTYDLTQIPRLINSIRDDYKIYIRHFKYIPFWDTNYYFI